MVRRTLPGDIRVLVSEELERRGFLAAFTERTGGASEAPYSSLNLGSEVGDSPQVVLENRGRLRAVLDVGDPVGARQVHGIAVRRVDGHEAPAEADALATGRRGLPLAVMTADCLPLALASEAEGTVAVVHVGWRGLAGGIVQQGMALFREPRHVAAALGPAIGPCHYEVGSEVVEAVRHGVGEAIVTPSAAGRSMLDLTATVERLLRRLGAQVVEAAELCTACEPRRFFSHRRDGITGRQALVAVRL